MIKSCIARSMTASLTIASTLAVKVAQLPTSESGVVRRMTWTSSCTDSGLLLMVMAGAPSWGGMPYAAATGKASRRLGLRRIFLTSPVGACV